MMPSMANFTSDRVPLPKPQELLVSQNNVSMTMRFQPHYKVGKLVTIAVTLKNLRGINVTCDNLPPYGNSIISLKRLLNGVKYDVPLTDFGKQYSPADPARAAGRVAHITLHPGMTYTTVIDINHLYKLTLPGTYVITVSRAINDFASDAFLIQNMPLQFQLVK